MKTFLDVGAALTILIVVYAVSAMFISLPDTNPYTFNAFPGSLIVIPSFFLFFYVLHSAWKRRRWYWLVGCMFCWPLSAVYYILKARKEFGPDAQQGVPADVARPAGERRG